MIFEDLKGKRVLVTGSSSGIGAATAIMFAQQGCFVGVHYFRTPEGGENTLAEVKKHSDGCLLRADMRDEAQVERLMADFVSAAGGLDILINNAGTLLGRVPIEGMTLEHFEDEFATNVRSTFLATRTALPYLKQSCGCIVNLGSVAGHTGGAAGSGVYASAKAAIHTMTIAMAREFGPYRIRVNGVLHPRTQKSRRQRNTARTQRHRRRRRQSDCLSVQRRGGGFCHRRIHRRQRRHVHAGLINTLLKVQPLRSPAECLSFV
jgi:3-oxoacyl-[acyl-carrier protein] reductase